MCIQTPACGADLLCAGLASDNVAMGKRVAVSEVLDRHHAKCPRCACPEAVVMLNANFEVHWQCVDCEYLWPASDEESSLMLNLTNNTIH